MADGKVDIFMPWFFGDYIKDTADLTAEEHGAYLLLLGHMWNRGGRLPSDPSRLARLAAVKESRWEAAWTTISRFFTVEGEEITQKRLAEELAKAIGNRRSAAERGKKGAAAKASAQAQLKPSSSPASSQVSTEPETGSSSSPSPPDPSLLLEDQDPERGRALSDGRWNSETWRQKFGLAWTAKYGGFYGGGDADSRAIGDLADQIAALPLADAVRAQERSATMFAEFLGDESPKVVKARHRFSWFVTAWAGLRVPKIKTAPDTSRAPAGPFYPRFIRDDRT